MPVFAGKAAGAFGAAGGTITIEWIPDPELLAQEILRVAHELQDFTIPLTIARQILKDDVRERFQTKTEPGGDKWDSWSDTYAPVAREYNVNGILERTGAMKNAVLSEAAWIMNDDNIILDLGVVRMVQTESVGEEYNIAILHHTGAVRSGPGARISGFESMSSFISAHDVDISKVNHMPPRPFIGPSFDANIRIVETFDKWFDDAISIGISSKGKIFGRHSKRGAIGRFVPL